MEILTELDLYSLIYGMLIKQQFYNKNCNTFLE